MNDMTPVIVPKSDQISADDLIGGPMTVTIKDVKIAPGTEQPVSIILEETDRLFRPCKSMSRVMVYGWGPDASKYIGRSLTLYRDPDVKWGGMAVGGIRISHMSHIDSAQTMVLAVTKGSRKPYKVSPLVVEQPATPEDKARAWTDKLIATIAATDTNEVAAILEKHAKTLAKLEKDRPELHAEVTAAAMPSDDYADAPHPATTAADRILTALDGITTATDLDALEAKEAETLDAMPDEIADTVRGAIAGKRDALSKELAA